MRSGANQYSSYVTCTLCNVRLSTTPKAKSFVGLAEAMTNSREDEETEEAKAKSHAEVMDLITKITEDTSLAMTADIEEMVETLPAKVGIGIWDTGCRKTVAGATWIKTYVQAWQDSVMLPSLRLALRSSSSETRAPCLAKSAGTYP